MKTDFEIKKIQEKLTELLNLGVIKNYDDLKKLKDIYIKDDKSCEDIIKEIDNLKFDKEKLNELLMKNEKIVHGLYAKNNKKMYLEKATCICYNGGS